MIKKNECVETNIVSMNVTTSRYVMHVCPSCGETFEHPEAGTTSYGAEYIRCPCCKVHLSVPFYEVAE